VRPDHHVDLTMPRKEKDKKPIMTGEEMRQRRHALRMTQEAFGRAIGKHRISISDYERGKFPIPDTVALLVRTLR
jgi:transcriptional regulator with XRE-family HTH domain